MSLNGVRALQAQYVGDGNAAGQTVKLPFTPHEAEIMWGTPTQPGLPLYPHVAWARRLDGADFTSVLGEEWNGLGFDGPHAKQLKFNSPSYAPALDALPEYLHLQDGGVFVRGPFNAPGVTYTVAARRFLDSGSLLARLRGSVPL